MSIIDTFRHLYHLSPARNGGLRRTLAMCLALALFVLAAFGIVIAILHFGD